MVPSRRPIGHFDRRRSLTGDCGLGTLNLGPQAVTFHYPIRELRSLARGRKRVVENRIDFKNEVYALLDQQDRSYDWDQFRAAGRDHLGDDQLDL